MSMLKVWSEDERLYLDYEDEDEFFLVTDIDYEWVIYEKTEIEFRINQKK